MWSISLNIARVQGEKTSKYLQNFYYFLGRKSTILKLRLDRVQDRFLYAKRQLGDLSV